MAALTVTELRELHGAAASAATAVYEALPPDDKTRAAALSGVGVPVEQRIAALHSLMFSSDRARLFVEFFVSAAFFLNELNTRPPEPPQRLRETLPEATTIH